MKAPELTSENQPFFTLRKHLQGITNENIEIVYKRNLNQFYLLESDIVEIDGQQRSITERTLYLLRDLPFTFNPCLTKDGFELTELDFLENQFIIIENGRQFILSHLKLRKQLAIYEAYLNQRKAALSKKPQQSNKVSFIWQGNAEKELPELYRLMLDEYKLIAPDTNLSQFKAVFTGQPIESIEPVKWIASNRLLAYFLNSAFLGQNWQSIAGNGNLFLNSKGKILKATDLSVAKNQYNEYGEPKGYEKIDLILSTIKKHSEH